VNESQPAGLNRTRPTGKGGTGSDLGRRFIIGDRLKGGTNGGKFAVKMSKKKNADEDGAGEPRSHKAVSRLWGGHREGRDDSGRNRPVQELGKGEKGPVGGGVGHTQDEGEALKKSVIWGKNTVPRLKIVKETVLDRQAGEGTQTKSSIVQKEEKKKTEPKG